MHKKRRFNLIITTLLVVALCFTSYSVALAKDTAASKWKEAEEAGKKAAAATKSFEAAEEKLEELQESIEETQAEIKKTDKKIEKKKAEIEEQEENLGNRLTAMYKTGTVGYVDVILSSEDIADLISNIGMVQKILESDQGMLKDLEKQHKKLKKLEKQLEEEELSLEQDKATTEELKKKYQKEADEWKKKEEQLRAESEALAAEAAGNADNAEALILKNGGSIDTSNFAWPTKANWIITSEYGWRICPFHGKEFHDGLDIVLSSGTSGSPVYAIADGIVTRASWYGGYGNCITLSCGGGYAALYGHLSGYNVKNGQYVNRGQVIGYIGSTGNSTGPHLHFMIFKGGSAISPWSVY